MAELTARLSQSWLSMRIRRSDLAWTLAIGGLGAIVVVAALKYSFQASCAVVLIVLVVAIYRHDRSWGIVALFAFWFLAPEIRRLLELLTGYVSTDPLSLAPFLATAALAGVELSRSKLPPTARRVLLLAAAGFAFGLPVGVLHPSAALYAFVAYLAGVSGAVLGFCEPRLLQRSGLRRIVLFGMVPIALYGLVQHVLQLPSWDQAWLDATGVTSIGTTSTGTVRVFATLNAPGALAPLLGLSVLCYLTVRGHRSLAAIGFAVVGVTLALTFVRSAWVALAAGALAHVLASRGTSARRVLGVAAIAVAATLALSPVSHTARDVVNRFTTIGSPGSDTSATARTATLGATLPTAVTAPVGHGLGSAGEPTKLTADTSLRAPDNGYLSLLYQVGPVGFILVVLAILVMLRAAWNGARARAPGQDLRLLLFSMFVLLLVSLVSGDDFYGSLGVIFWFIGGQALAFQHAQRTRGAASASL